MTTGSGGQAPADGFVVFISYARNDDETPPFDDATHGWVTFFWHQLRFELINAGLPEAKQWLDRFEIDPIEEFTPAIEAALQRAELIIPVLSENWVKRDWCRRELETFCALRPGANDNIILVVKDEPISLPRPAPLAGRDGYRFFAREPSGDVRDFYWRGLEDKKAYNALLRKIARSIVQRLLNAPAGMRTRASCAVSNGRTIFVAVAADELRDARQRLVNDLTAAGYAVVPADDRLPDTVAAAETTVHDALRGAEMAVHLLGETHGAKPGDGAEAIVPLQLRLARGQAIRRVLWAPRWLPGRPEAKRDPFVVVGQYGDLQAGEEVYDKEVTDLSQWLRARLEPAAQPDARAGQPVVLVAAAASVDDELALALAGRLPEDDVRPLFAGDPPPTDAGRPQIVIPWGKADRAALDALLAAVRPIAGGVTVLRLPGGDESAKQRFFAKGVFVEPLAALPEGRRAPRELLVRLEILGPAP